MAASPNNLKLLVIEDNPGDLVLIKEYLSESLKKPDVIHVSTFGEAQKQLSSNNNFDVILLDLSLPDLSGEKLLKEVVSISDQVPIIVLTGYENKDFGLKTLGMGAADYLLKDEINPFLLSKVIAYSIERNKVSQSLQKSEKKYRDIFNLSPQPMFLIDVNTRMIRDVNEAAIKQYGYTKKEFIGLHLKDIRPENELSYFKNEIEKIDKNTSQFYHTTVKHQKKTGEVFDVELSTSDMILDDKPMRMALAEDVTEKRKAERQIKQKSNLLAANAKVTGKLIKSENWLEALDDTLKIIGKAVQVDRVYYFENSVDPKTGEMLTSQKIEWTSEAVTSELDNPDLQNIPMAEFPEIFPVLSKNEIFQTLVKDLPRSSFRELLETQNIVSILHFPIFVDGRFHGFIGFDDCTKERVWSEEEVQYLQTLGTNISSAIKVRITTDELRINEYKFKALVQEGSDMIGIMNEDFSFTYISPSIGEMYEYYVGINALDLVHPEDKERVKKVLKQLPKEKRVAIAPYRMHNHNGQYFWIETIITNLLNEPAIKGYVANSRNVTEKIKREKELQESLERYDIVNKATSDIIWDLDIETDQMLYNDNIYSMFGYQKKQVEDVGSWWRNKIHPDDIHVVTEAISEVRKNETERIQMEYRFQIADGSYKYILDRAFVIKDDNGIPIRMIGAMQDITQEREEEERLKLLESVITNTSESVVILDAEKGKYGREIIFTNNAFTKLTGYSEEEVIGKTLHFLNGPDTDKSIRNKLREAMDNYKPLEVEFINYKKDGEKFWINTSMVPVQNNKGDFTHWVAIGRDITDRKQNEKAIKSSLSEKETLLAEIHHRVKNNLAVVSGMMQLQAFESDNEVLQEKLYDSVVRIKTMATVHELLYQSNSFSKLEFSDTLKKLVENISETLQPDHKIGIDIHCDPVTLNINQAIPASLIVNEVITNAYKHAFRDSKTGKISFNLQEENTEIIIEIIDNGAGFPEEKLNKGGSLGIHLINVLCDQINGTGTYKNTGNGTNFTLRFERQETKKGIGNTEFD